MDKAGGIFLFGLAVIILLMVASRPESPQDPFSTTEAIPESAVERIPEADRFREALGIGSRAVTSGEAGNWPGAVMGWESAIALLESSSDERAPNKINEYEGNLAEAQLQNAFAIAMRAVELGRDRRQWREAIAEWEEAIDQLEEIGAGTVPHGQAIAKIAEYQGYVEQLAPWFHDRTAAIFQQPTWDNSGFNPRITGEITFNRTCRYAAVYFTVKEYPNGVLVDTAWTNQVNVPANTPWRFDTLVSGTRSGRRYNWNFSHYECR